MVAGSEDEVSIPGPAAIRYLKGTSGDLHGGIYGPSGEFLITFGSGVSASLLANWIWAAIKKSPPPTLVKIDRIEVEFEEGAIKRLVTERIERPSEAEKLPDSN
jgi:hypothetical protein